MAQRPTLVQGLVHRGGPVPAGHRRDMFLAQRGCHRTQTMNQSKGPPGAGGREAPEAWQATAAQTALATQLLSPEDGVETVQHDIGRAVGPNERELFVTCEPALAMQQQFEHHGPEYIAVHDVSTSSSRKLLAGIAAASASQVRKLAIRRQGYGTPLATIEYVELPTAEGATLRLYSTDSDTDSATRAGLARVLVGDVPPHAMAATFKPLHDDMTGGYWNNRHMLLLPLAAASALVHQGSELARGTMVEVRTTPQVTRPADAWGFINGTWARMAAEGQLAGVRLPRTPPAPPVRPAGGDTEVMPLRMRPMPAVPLAPPVRPIAPPANLLERYVEQLSELTGMVSVCVFDLATGREVAHAGASPGPKELATHGAELMASIFSTSRTLGLGHAMPDTAVTLGAHHLLLRPVPRHPGLALHAVLDKGQANLTLARLQVQRMDALFEAEAPPAR